jgi:tetratricopeptide (TPR) repeat protein
MKQRSSHVLWGAIIRIFELKEYLQIFKNIFFMSKITGLPMLIFCLLLLAQTATADKQTLQKGWDAFNANNRKEAKDFFGKAALDDDTKADANLALALVWWSEDKDDEGFKSFLNFFNAAENPYPYLYALWNSPVVFQGYEKKNEEKVKFLKRLTDESKTNGSIHAMAHSMLGKHYETVGDFKKAEHEFSQTGAIENWQVLGTFDNTSGSGFNKDYGALANAETDAVLKNKNEADVKWFTPPHVRSDRWFDFEYYFLINNSVMYAQTFLKSDAGKEVFFRSGNSGSLKIWVNDKLVTNVAEERNCDLDIYINNVKLNKGYNRVLVQIGESETNAANFMIRVTDKDGNNMSGISSTSVYQPYSKATEYAVKSSTLFAEDFFENKIKSEPDNLLNYLMLSDVYLRNDKVYEARKALKKAKELAPKSSFVGTRMIEAYAREKNVTDLTKEYERIKSTDPDCSYALKGLINEAREKEDYDEEEKLLEKYKSIYGNDEYTQLILLNIAASRNKYDEVVKMAQELYQKYPDNFDLMNLNYTIERNTSKDLAKASEILNAYLKNNYSDKVLTTLAGNYFDLGKTKEGYDLYKERIENVPYSIGFYTDLSELYFAAQDYENALKWAHEALSFAPYIGGYWNKVGKIYEAMKNEDKAKEAYRKAIYFTPTNYEARKHLRKLEGKKDLFENFEKADAYELFKKAPIKDSFPDDNSIILLNETQRVVYPEGATEERSEVLIKIFNQNGIDRWKEYSIGYNRYSQRLLVDKAEVFKKDGNKVQAEKNDDYLVFTNLEAGDAIHLSYRIENYSSGKLSKHFWEQFNFNFDFPVQTSRYSLLLPASKQFKYEVLNANMKPTIKDLDDMKLYVWEYKTQPAIKPESYMPPLTDVGTVLNISSIPDWKYISNWYSDLSTSLAKQDFEIKETVAELFKDKKNLNELQKAKVIYNFIEENVSYSNVPFMHGPIIPQKASRTLNTKLGDCKDVSTLFVAMCKEAGLKANLILVDTRDNGEKHLSLPSVDFNHCVAQLRTGGKNYYVELTDQKLSFGSIPTADLNSNILFIPRDGDTAATQLSKFNSKNRVLNSLVRETNLKFENNDFNFIRKTWKTGVFASQMRNDYADKGKDKQEKSITQAVASEFTNPAKLLHLTLPDLKTLSDTVCYEYAFNIKNELTEVVGIKIFRIPWSEAARSLDFLSLETRQFPFFTWAFSAAEVSKEIMNIEIPKGKALVEQPKSVSLSCPVAEYSLTYNTTVPGKIKAVREMKFKKDVVETNEYAQFREFFNKVSEADSKQLGFK